MITNKYYYINPHPHHQPHSLYLHACIAFEEFVFCRMNQTATSLTLDTALILILIERKAEQVHAFGSAAYYA